MAIYSTGLWWAAVVLLLGIPHTHCLDVRRGDVTYTRISQIIYLTRVLEDKLERHEQRERLLGEQIKKLLTALDTHQTDLAGKASRLDDRLATVESTMITMDERTKSIKETLEKLDLQRRFDATDTKIDAVDQEIRNVKKSVSSESLRALCPVVTTDTTPFEKAISDSETLLNKYEQKLSEYNNTAATAAQTGAARLNEVAAADEARHSEMTEVMERQENEIANIQQLLADAASIWKDLPRLADLNRSTNQNLEAIASSTRTILTNDNTLATDLELKMRELGENLNTTNKSVHRTLNEGIVAPLASMAIQVQSLYNNRNMVQKISDNVDFVKKHLEIVENLETAIFNEVQKGNKFVDKKLDSLQREIIDNQTLELNNLSSILNQQVNGISSQVNYISRQIQINQDKLTNITDTSQTCNDSSTTFMNKLDTVESGILKELKTVREQCKHTANSQLATNNQRLPNRSRVQIKPPPLPPLEPPPQVPYRLTDDMTIHK